MVCSSGAAASAPGGALACFSTGKLSPVSELWMTKRSLACTIRRSPGIMSPAASWMTSPGTSCVIGTSPGAPSRRTVAWTEIMALSAAAAVPAFASWTSFKPTLSTIIMSITAPARRSPVESESAASAASRSTSGFITARHSNVERPARSSRARTFGPYSTSRASASAEVRPPARVASCAKTAAGSRAALARRSGATRIAARTARRPGPGPGPGASVTAATDARPRDRVRPSAARRCASSRPARPGRTACSSRSGCRADAPPARSSLDDRSPDT